MKLVKTQIELDVYGTKANIRKPTFKEAQQYRDELKKLEVTDDATPVMQGFLEKLGLSKELFEQLELGHVSDIMELVTDSKKK